MLGNNLVHLEYLYDPDEGLDFDDNDSCHYGCKYFSTLQTCYGSAWRHVICERDGPEEGPDEKVTLSNIDKTLFSRPHECCSTDYEEEDPAYPIDF